MVPKRPAGDPAQGPEARGVSGARGNWNDVWSNFDQRRKAKAGEAANEAGVGVEAGEPDMFGDGASVAAECLKYNIPVINLGLHLTLARLLDSSGIWRPG